MKSDIDKRINERKTTDEIDFNQDAMISSFYFEIMHFEQLLDNYGYKPTYDRNRTWITMKKGVWCMDQSNQPF